MYKNHVIFVCRINTSGTHTLFFIIPATATDLMLLYLEATYLSPLSSFSQSQLPLDYRNDP
uniref:Uncharacterized protein n=1 Tax=Arundo donax TaxID=35708 RepID=A0A0A9GVB4_ARUDO